MSPTLLAETPQIQQVEQGVLLALRAVKCGNTKAAVAALERVAQRLGIVPASETVRQARRVARLARTTQG